MGINTFVASGNVGKDLEVRVTPNGKHIGSFPLPVKSGWGDNEKTSWVTCKMFGERVQKLAQYITKGTKLTVSGAFVMDEWENNGVKHSRPVILINDFEFGGGAHGQQQQQGGGYQQQQPARQQAPNRSAPQQMSEPDFDFDGDLDF